MTDVDICNLALGYIGDAANVSSIAPPDGSAQSIHCARYYPLAVSLLLEGHEWGFVTTRAELVPVSYDYDNWQFAYGLPSYCNQVISVIPQYEYDAQLDWSSGWGSYDWSWNGWYPFEQRTQGKWPFMLETNPDGVLVILSNAIDPVCRYITSQFSSTSFPAQFSEALAWRLASMLAGPIIKGDAGAAESKRCMQMFAATIGQAQMQDANQQNGSMRPHPIWTRDR